MPRTGRSGTVLVVLRNFFDRFRKRADERAVEEEIEEEQMSPEERRRVQTSIEDLQADNLAEFESQTGTSIRHFDDDEEKPRP
jgi:hypothetical protein